MRTFTAIDFETATGYHTSICQIGLIYVVDGKISTELNILVQPPENEYWSRNIGIHGISPKHTAHSPSFAAVWPQIEPFIRAQTLVAHNGFSFDFPVLNKTLAYYNIPVPEYERQCTYRIYGGALADLCEKHHIPLQHHDALSDARACAELYLKYLINLK